MPTPLRAALVLALAAPALAACSGAPGADVPDLPVVEPAWEIDDGVMPFAAREGAPPALWGTDDLVVPVGGPVRENRIDLTGLDRTDGTTAWTLRLDGSLCTISSGLTDEGVGAVLYRPTPSAECVGVAAVDTATGVTLWTTELEVPRRLGRDRQAIVPGVGIGETSVNATSGCGRVTRLDLADGSPIETLGRLAPGFGCTGPGGVGGSLVAYADGSGRDAETVLLDTDATGREAVVWRRPDRGVIEAIPSADPLLLDRTDASGRLVRSAGADGQETALGLRMSPSGVGGFTPTATADGVVVGRYDGAEEEVAALDTTTDDQVWERPQVRYGPDRRLVGARGDELVWVQGFSDPEAPADDRVWVTTSDPREPDVGRTLGSIGPGPGLLSSLGDLWVVSGDLLINYGSTGMTAYDLAVADADATEGVTEVPDGYLDDIDDDLSWSDDDVRPAAVLGACRDVSSATLEGIGLDPALPAPVRCGWSETTPGGRSTLDVTVEAAEPSTDETASEVAARRLADTPPLDGAPREVDLGDGAVLSRDDSAEVATAAERSNTVVLRVRRSNVLVDVRVTSSGPWAAQPRRVPPEGLETLAADVVRDVLADADLDLDAPAPGQAGPVTTAPGGGCADTPALRRLVPGGARGTARTSDDGRVRSCVRLGPGEQYPEASTDVTTEAVGPGLGTSAVEAATARLDALEGEQVPGLGDQAVLVEGGSSFQQAAALVVRRDNLVVVVRAQETSFDLAPVRVSDLRRVASGALGATRG